MNRPKSDHLGLGSSINSTLGKPTNLYLSIVAIWFSRRFLSMIGILKFEKGSYFCWTRDRAAWALVVQSIHKSLLLSYVSSLALQNFLGDMKQMIAYSPWLLQDMDWPLPNDWAMLGSVTWSSLKHAWYKLCQMFTRFLGTKLTRLAQWSENYVEGRLSCHRGGHFSNIGGQVKLAKQKYETFA